MKFGAAPLGTNPDTAPEDDPADDGETDGHWYETAWGEIDARFRGGPDNAGGQEGESNEVQ